MSESSRGKRVLEAAEKANKKSKTTHKKEPPPSPLESLKQSLSPASRRQSTIKSPSKSPMSIASNMTPYARSSPAISSSNELGSPYSNRTKPKSGRRLFGIQRASLPYLPEESSNQSPIRRDLPPIPSVVDSKMSAELKQKQSRLNERIDALLSDTPRLLLPMDYQILLSMFRALETVISVYRGRNVKSVTYNNVKKSVERLVTPSRTFFKKHLGQINTIYPEAYNITVIRVKDINEHYEYQYRITWQNTNDTSTNTDSHRSIRETDLKNRIITFEKRLFDRVHRYHREYLEANSYPLMNPTLMRAWHSSFPLEACPSIPITLPEIPKHQRSKSHEAIEKLIQKHRSETQSRIESMSSSDASESTNDDDLSSLSGVSSNLLAKIRARSKDISTDMNKKGPEQRARIRMVQSLSRLVDSLHSMYTAKKRQALPLQDVIRDLIRSGGPSKETFLKQLNILIKIAPEWCDRFSIGRGASSKEILRISKKVALSQIKQKVLDHQQELINELDKSKARPLMTSNSSVNSSPGVSDNTVASPVSVSSVISNKGGQRLKK